MKTLKIITAIFFLTTFFQAEALLASQPGGSRQKRDITGFHAISVTAGIDLYLTQKNTEEVFVEAEPDMLDKIITKVEGGILKIYMKEKSWFNLSRNNEPRKVYVSFKTLDRLDASAGADINSQSTLKFDKLKVEASSGADVTLELEANELYVGSSSGSDIRVKGKSTTIQADASSGSDINASELEAKQCQASVSSGSDIRVNVTEVLDASASSGGDIIYYGNPKTKNISKSSGGDIHAK